MEVSSGSVCGSTDRSTSELGSGIPSADEQGRIKDFFPATTDAFEPKCGVIESLRESDFLDVHRRRHLDSFKQSWDEWAAFDSTKRPEVPDKQVYEFVRRLIAADPRTTQQLASLQRALRRELHVAPSKSQMLAAYEDLNVQAGVSNSNPVLDQFLIKKVVRTHSGVVVITVLTSPGSFSCPQDCHYCPNEPGQPRSYLSTEPAVLRANQNGWDPAAQFWDRAITLYNNGHTIDKIEVLVLGGTWSGYPKSYQEEFVRDLFFAANTFHLALAQKRQLARDALSAATTAAAMRTAERGIRERWTLEEEQRFNRSADCRIIGLTLETRPDHISPGELRRLRRFGCTRVQIGIQHTDDAILAKINRGCYLRHAIRAIRLLKDGCFKVDVHLMPDLPGSNPELDKKMFETMLSSSALQADQWKIYPCEVTPFSEIEKWYKTGAFVPYAEKNDGLELTQLLVKVKTAVHPWIRLNRVVRDIPNPSIIAGNDKTNLRQILQTCMEKRGLVCRCLRCREVKTKLLNPEDACLKIRQYASFGGTDYFLSFESNDEQHLFAFLRLRIRSPPGSAAQPGLRKGRTSTSAEHNDEDDGLYDLSRTFPELEGCGLVRELHVYGLLVGSKERKQNDDTRPQHTGFGKRLLAAAEVITLSHSLCKMAVIAGVGTTEYYRKFEYQIERHFMTKPLSTASVLRWVEELHMQLPLNVQVYDVQTDLGTLIGSTLSQPLASEAASARNPAASRRFRDAEYVPVEENRPLQHNDLLSAIETNCVPEKTSHAMCVRKVHITSPPVAVGTRLYRMLNGIRSRKRPLLSLWVPVATVAVTSGLLLLWLRRKR